MEPRSPRHNNAVKELKSVLEFLVRILYVGNTKSRSK